MKKFITTCLTIAGITFSIIVNAQNPSEKINIRHSKFVVKEETPVLLSVKNDKVQLAFDIEIPTKLIRTTEALQVTPIIANGSYVKDLPSISIEGRIYEIRLNEMIRFDSKVNPNHLERIRYQGKDTMVIHYQYELALEDQMKGALFSVEYSILRICGSLLFKTTSQLSSGIEYFQDLISSDQILFSYPTTTEHTLYTDFGNQSLFRQGKIDFDRSVINASDYDNFLISAELIKNDPYISIDAINVTASASPEGWYNI